MPTDPTADRYNHMPLAEVYQILEERIANNWTNGADVRWLLDRVKEFEEAARRVRYT